MKVVINRCWGGFNLSEKAILQCVARGMKLTHYDASGNYVDSSAEFVDRGEDREVGRYRLCSKLEYNKEFRTNPIVIETVEQLGEEANGPYAKLKVIDVPFENLEDWYIDEYDGKETIREKHREWN
jgi:hypothetical protein